MNKKLGGVFSSAWCIFTGNSKALFTGTIAFALPIIVLLSVAGIFLSEPWAYGIPIVISVYILLITPLYFGYMTSVIRAWNLTGQRPRIASAWAAAKANYGEYLKTWLVALALYLAYFFIVGLIVVLIAVVCIMGKYILISPDAEGIDTLPFSIAIGIAAFVFSLGMQFIAFIPGMEHRKGMKAVVCSFSYVMRGNFWKTLGHMLILTLITLGVQTIVLLIVANCLAFISNGSEMPPLQKLYILVTGPVFVFIRSIVTIPIGILIQMFSFPYTFEVYRNAKNIYDEKSKKYSQNRYLGGSEL